VTSIGDGSFYGCKSLANVTIPNGVTSIGGGAFNGCDNLKAYVYENSYAEEYCIDWSIPYVLHGDFTYTVSNSCGELDSEFADEATITGYTGSATELVIPSTLGGLPVVAIGLDAFAECDSLTSILTRLWFVTNA
jgi:hypothetical protein